MSCERIPLVGIVGGIGSGKSTVAKALGTVFRVQILDADRAGHEVLRKKEIIEQLVSHFGHQILSPEGSIVRGELAKQVFGDSPEQLQARKTLEKIVHPAIHQMLLDQLAEHRKQADCELILLDAALLFEANWQNHCDAIVFLEVPLSERVRRVASRGWSEEELARRESSQMPLSEKRHRADLVIDQTQPVEEIAHELGGWLGNRFPHLGFRSIQTGKSDTGNATIA